jgi:hypothetical protein
MLLSTERGIDVPSFSLATSLESLATLPHFPVVEMAHFSNVIIHGSTINSAQGDLHIINDRDPESGMHNIRFIRSEERPYR